jgi:predicted MPP superfamily phosphohydrolase
MDFPRAVTVLFLFFIFYIFTQCYLFIRLRDVVIARVQDRAKRRLFYGLIASFFSLMALIFPIAHYFAALYPYEPYSLALRVVYAVCAIWGFGSAGFAALLLGCEVYRRIFPVRSTQHAAEPNLQRRKFMKTSLSVAAAAPFIISGYGVLLGRRRFQVEHFDLPVQGLSSALSALSIVQLTDIHVGPFMPEDELGAYVETVNRLQPDLIALTGDFVSSGIDEVPPCVNTLAGLKARYGIFACLGNHDVYARAENELTRLFAEKNIHVLRNQGASIPVGNTELSVLGIDDMRYGASPNLSHAIEAFQEDPGEVRLLLSHRPEVFPEAAGKGLDIVLAGHYHGGQVKLAPDPKSLSVARLITPYPEGLFRLPGRSNPSSSTRKDATLFVSRGIGITGLPIRINCPPQIAHLTLKKA